MKRISIITIASLASALVLSQPAHAGLLGAGGALGGGLGGQAGPGAIGGQFGIDGGAYGHLARPDTSRVGGTLDKAQGQGQAVHDGALNKAGDARQRTIGAAGAAQTDAAAKAGTARDLAARPSGELRGSAGAATRSADGSVGTSGHADTMRGGASVQAGGAGAASVQH